jgi:hypothetical protein
MRRAYDLALAATMTAVAFAGPVVFWLPPGQAMFRHFSETFTSPSLPDVVASRAAATAVPLLLIPRSRSSSRSGCRPHAAGCGRGTSPPASS